MRPNSAITPDEEALLFEVSGILDDACDATPGNMTADELIATGWPKRIQPVAYKALNLMRVRGRFSEENEEDAPSG
jgi:glycine cleavage system aminomethyltransferase T